MYVLDHVFILCAKRAPEAESLTRAGLTEGSHNTHPGQGTAAAEPLLTLRFGRSAKEAGSLGHAAGATPRPALLGALGQEASPAGFPVSGLYGPRPACHPPTRSDFLKRDDKPRVGLGHRLALLLVGVGRGNDDVGAVPRHLDVSRLTEGDDWVCNAILLGVGVEVIRPIRERRRTLPREGC